MTEDWKLDAACIDADSDIFFPGKGTPTSEAKKLCAVCPVQVDCLEYALEHRIKFGIWGGQSNRERNRIRRRRNAA